MRAKKLTDFNEEVLMRKFTFSIMSKLSGKIYILVNQAPDYHKAKQAAEQSAPIITGTNKFTIRKVSESQPYKVQIRPS